MYLCSKPFHGRNEFQAKPEHQVVFSREALHHPSSKADGNAFLPLLLDLKEELGQLVQLLKLMYAHLLQIILSNLTQNNHER